MKWNPEAKPDSDEHRALAEGAWMTKIIADMANAHEVLRENLYGLPRGKNAGGSS